MKIALIQFAPLKGNINGSIAKVENLIRNIRRGDIDLILLPEMAFAGYNFPSLEAIKPYLENAQSGPTSVWARTTAQRLQSIVTVGYAETVHPILIKNNRINNSNISNNYLKKKDKNDDNKMDRTMNFNSNIAYDPQGTMIANYRKHFLFMVDESWCSEGSERFYAGNYPEPVNQRVAMGICMDINPYQFKTPWEAMEFANHARDSGASLILICTAWTNISVIPHEFCNESNSMIPDWDTIRYWISRFEPVIQAERSVLLAFGNRCGAEENAVFVGTSLVLQVGQGKVETWDILGRGEERLLIVDTNTKPRLIWDFEAEEFRFNKQNNVN